MFTKQITSLSDTNQGHYSTNIWENRKDLGKCPIWVGYLDYVALLGSIKHNQTQAGEDAQTSLVPESSSTLRADGLIMHGIKVQLFSFLYSKLNFSIKWVRVEDNKFGAFDSVLNYWNWIVGMIKRNEIDTSILDLSITNVRSDVVAFSIPIQGYSNVLFMRKPGPSVSWTTFLNVFNLLYWYIILVFMIVFVFFWLPYHIIQKKKIPRVG